MLLNVSKLSQHFLYLPLCPQKRVFPLLFGCFVTQFAFLYAVMQQALSAFSVPGSRPGAGVVKPWPLLLGAYRLEGDRHVTD